MTVKLGMRVFWNHGPMPVTTRKNARLAMTVPFGTVMNLGGGTGGGAVNSVNGKTGNVVLVAADVGADPAGTASALFTPNIDFVGLIDATMEI